MNATGIRRMGRWLAGLTLLLALALSGVGWLLSSPYAQSRVRQRVRAQLTQGSELVLDSLDVSFSVWRDFPHLTASLQHLALTDTSHGRAVRVLTVERADLRLSLRALLQKRVQVTRLRLLDVALTQRVDSAGRSWGLRGARRAAATKVPTAEGTLDSLLIENFTLDTRNAYIGSALRARVARARLAASLRGGVLRVDGRATGWLDELRNRTGELLANEPVRASLRYDYDFGQRRGTFRAGTEATLRGDTIRVSGGHRADTAAVPRGTVLGLRFEGRQPLLGVLGTVLPPSLRPFLREASSPSQAHIRYELSGLSGPRVRPHVVFGFQLRGARVRWPDPARRIDDWNLTGTFDNGPGHRPETMSLTLTECRILSPAGRLDVAFSARNFRQPELRGRLHGLTELPALAGLLGLAGPWRARAGTADLDISVRGRLPAAGTARREFLTQTHLAVRGTATLRGATLDFGPGRPDLHGLNVRIGLLDSVWQLSRATGVLAGMRFEARGTTRYLVDYLLGRRPATDIRGELRLDQLDLASLRALLRRRPRLAGTAGAAVGGRVTTSPAIARATAAAPAGPPAARTADALARPGPTTSAATAAARPRRSRAARQRIAATLGSRFVPAGLRFDVALRCGRLGLATDTLRALAVRVRHDGERIRLSELRGSLWGGQVRGAAEWPTDTANAVAPVTYDLRFQFDTLSYAHLLERLSRPPRHPAGRPGSPALRELLLAANGHMRYEIAALRLPTGEQLRQLRLSLEKRGNVLILPDLRFVAPQGGTGFGSATATLDGLHLSAADASLDLRYLNLDVPQLLRTLASVAPARPDSAGAAARDARRAARIARAAQAGTGIGTGAGPGRVLGQPSVFVDGTLTARLLVQAEQVRYGPVRGSQFALRSRLRAGEALLDDCTLNAFGGRVTLRGRLQTDAGRQHHPLQGQLLLDDLDLGALFSTLSALRPSLPGADNIRGRLRCAAALRTDLDERFLLESDNTNAYLKADLRGLELVDMEALREVFRFRPLQRRAEHLYFEPVSSEFMLSRGELLIPDLRLNSNLTELLLHGRYDLDGRADLFLGLSPLHSLLGNNAQRTARIQAGEPVRRRPGGRLTYVRLHREAPRTKYRVQLFQQKEQAQAQAELRRQCRQLLISQRLDTTLKLLPQLRLTTRSGE